ncbi:uncharacterized protein Polr2M [Chironomus tepperi]|uniref:uncharacterized protein Polr2M n=1 Tax=Chironomus tepperi TaxID=113505 RepID=UPI00391FA895
MTENPFNFHQPPIHRVPGETKIKNQYALNDDLTKLTRRELLDIESRQLKLLQNKSWLNKLPDKGKKIQDLYDRVVKALEFKNEVQNAAYLLSSLSLGSNNLNNLEWEGSTEPQKKPQVIDSDDDEVENPLEILVSSNSVYSNKKIIKQKTDENSKPLITEQDIKEAKEIQNGELHLDPVIEKICNYDKKEIPFRFLPHKSTEQPCPLKKKDMSPNTKTVNKHDNKGCEQIPLKESIVMEHKCRKNRQESLEKQAMERLEAKKKELEAAGLKLSEPPTIIPSMTKYRLPPDEYDEIILRDDEDDLSEDTLSDEEDK